MPWRSAIFALFLLAHFNAEFPHGAKHSQSVGNFKLFNPKLPFYLISCGLMNTRDPNTFVDICLPSLFSHRSRGIFFTPLIPFTSPQLVNSTRQKQNTPATTRCGFKDLDAKPSLPGKETIKDSYDKKSLKIL